MNTLYYGDNLNILRHDLSEPGAVATGFPLCDLVYLEPPFNSNRRSARLSNRNYNVLFKDESGLEDDSQIVLIYTTFDECTNLARTRPSDSEARSR